MRSSACGCEDVQNLTVRNKDGNMIPLGTLLTITPIGGPVADQPLQSLSVGDHHRRAGARLLVRPGDDADGADRRGRRCRPAAASNGRAMSYQEKLVGNQMYFVFALGAAAGLSGAGRPVRELVSRRSSVILAVPLSLIGPVLVLSALVHRVEQQSLRPDRPRAADRAVGQERHPDRRGRARTAGRGQVDRRSRRSRPRAPASGRS